MRQPDDDPAEVSEQFRRRNSGAQIEHGQQQVALPWHRPGDSCLVDTVRVDPPRLRTLISRVGRRRVGSATGSEPTGRGTPGDSQPTADCAEDRTPGQSRIVGSHGRSV